MATSGFSVSVAVVDEIRHPMSEQSLDLGAQPGSRTSRSLSNRIYEAEYRVRKLAIKCGLLPATALRHLRHGLNFRVSGTALLSLDETFRFLLRQIAVSGLGLAAGIAAASVGDRSPARPEPPPRTSIQAKADSRTKATPIPRPRPPRDPCPIAVWANGHEEK